MIEKEILQIVLDRLNRLEEKIDSRDRLFITLLATIALNILLLWFKK